MRPKAIAHYKKYGGMWFVVHSDRKMFSNMVSDYFPEKHEAEAAKDSLSGQYPAEQLFIIQNKTLAEAQANWREDKELAKLNVRFYQVTSKTTPYILGIFASQFKAVRALRRIRRRYPDAYLAENAAYYHKDDRKRRDSLVRRIMR